MQTQEDVRDEQSETIAPVDPGTENICDGCA